MIPNIYTAYCDGSIEGGHGVGGWVLKQEDFILASGCVDLGISAEVTNNCAEYAGVIGALEWVSTHAPKKDLLIHSDSQLVINQMSGNWACNSPLLKKLRAVALEKSSKINSVEYIWIPREQNSLADQVSRSLYKGQSFCGDEMFFETKLNLKSL